MQVPPTCAFVRGGDLLVVVGVSDDVGAASLDAPRGRWRDVLTGEERSFSATVPVAGVVGDHGFAVLERAGGVSAAALSRSGLDERPQRLGSSWIELGAAVGDELGERGVV